MDSSLVEVVRTALGRHSSTYIRVTLDIAGGRAHAYDLRNAYLGSVCLDWELDYDPESNSHGYRFKARGK